MVTSSELDIKREKFVVNSADIPLGGGMMSVSASRIEYLPFEEGSYE